MNIYKVYNLSLFGHAENELYFTSPISAEKEFHSRVRDGILSEDLPEKGFDDAAPWRVWVGDNSHPLCRDESIKLKATIHYWDTHSTQEGTESDVYSYDIIFKSVEVVK